MIKNKGNRFYKYIDLIIFVTIILVGTATALYLYGLESHSLYFYSDSTTHALQARRYMDSNNPGFFEHLGTVWLPLPHLMLLPFTLIDPLFRSGFAGLIVSLTSHAITSLLIYKIIRRYTDNPNIPVVGAFLYAFNPNFLYLSLVPLTEAPFMLFFIATAYCFQEWLFGATMPSKKDITHKTTTKRQSLWNHITSQNSNIIKSAFFISLATLCRYEGWLLSISLVIMVIGILVVKSRNIDINKIKRNTLLLILIFSTISFSGMIFWIIWNWYYYGDPLEFADNPIYSAGGQALRGGKREFLYLQPINVSSVYGTVMFYVFGPVILVAALTGFISSTFYSKDKYRSNRILLYIFLVIPTIFTITTMISGVGEMELSNWFNSRFLLFSAPLIIILSSMFLILIFNKVSHFEIKRKHIIVVLSVVSLFLSQSVSSLFTVVTYADAFTQFSYEDRYSQLSVGQFLHRVYNSNSTIFLIVTGGVESNIAIESGLSMKSFRVIRDGDSGSPEFQMPWLYTDYLVLTKVPKEENKYVGNYWISKQDILGQYYNKVYEDDYYIIFSIKRGEKLSCINYDSLARIISVTCDSSNLSDVYSRLNKSMVLIKEPSRSWLLNANLEINNRSTFYISSDDTDWLKINSTDGNHYSIKAHGNLVIDSVKITGWDTKKNDYSREDVNGTIPRGYIVAENGVGRINVTNSEIAYLGYNQAEGFGLTYYTGNGSIISSNKIHDMYFGFYSQNNVHDILIENNEFYNNTEHGIVPQNGTHNLTITNNKVYNNGKHGIICATNCYNVRIESNRIFNNTQEGIILYNNASNSSIRNNMLTNNRDQIALYDSSDNNKISNNTIIQGNVGIRLINDSSHNLLTHNDIINSIYGIYLLEGASFNEIDSNTIVNTSDTAILIQDLDTKNNTFKSNALLDNQKNEISRSNLGTSRQLFINNTIGNLH
jgi:parallel beta-helix repeat protein